MPVTAKVGGLGPDQTAVSVTETEGGPAELESPSSQWGCQNDSWNFFFIFIFFSKLKVTIKLTSLHFKHLSCIR